MSALGFLASMATRVENCDYLLKIGSVEASASRQPHLRSMFAPERNIRLERASNEQPGCRLCDQPAHGTMRLARMGAVERHCRRWRGTRVFCPSWSPRAAQVQDQLMCTSLCSVAVCQILRSHTDDRDIASKGACPNIAVYVACRLSHGSHGAAGRHAERPRGRPCATRCMPAE